MTSGEKDKMMILALIFYTAVLVLAAWAGIQLNGISVFALTRPRENISAEIIIIGMTVGLHIAALKYAPRRLRIYKDLLDEFKPIAQNLTPFKIIILCLAGSFAEEALFRGALQPRLGAITSILLFGLAHFPVSKNLLAWPFFAMLIGIPLAALRIVSGDIYSAVLLHGLVNFISFFWLLRLSD